MEKYTHDEYTVLLAMIARQYGIAVKKHEGAKTSKNLARVVLLKSIYDIAYANAIDGDCLRVIE